MSFSKEPLVSIILLNYNGEKFASLWESVFKSEYGNFEIIFVDNGSKDGSLSLFLNLKDKNPGVRVEIVRIKENIGYSRANNRGLEFTHGEYVVLLSNDIEVEKDWLRNMIDFMGSHKDVAVAQSMMYSIYNRTEPDRMGNHIDVLGFNHPFKPSGKVEEVFYSEGAVMFIRKLVINEVGGLFDETFFMFFEDVDFSWRVRLRGYRICVVPSSIVYHVRGGTVTGTVIKMNPTYIMTNSRNRLITLFKNYDAYNMFVYGSLSLLSEIGESLWLMVNNQGALGLACLKGVLAFIRMTPHLLKKRMYVQSLRKIGDDRILALVFPIGVAVSSLIRTSQDAKREFQESCGHIGQSG